LPLADTSRGERKKSRGKKKERGLTLKRGKKICSKKERNRCMPITVQEGEGKEKKWGGKGGGKTGSLME